MCIVGWRAEGLYMGMEVFDNDPVAAPITECWWTRDMIELWISTRPVASDQIGYNSTRHQFMFVPATPPATTASPARSANGTGPAMR